MLLAMIATIALLFGFLYDLYRATLDRRTRWTFYALRDELRWAAIKDKNLLASPLFWRLDESLTSNARCLDYLSLWTLLPFIIAAERPEQLHEQKVLKDELRRPENASIVSIQSRATRAIMIHLTQRHLVVTVLVRAIVGISKLSRVARSVTLGQVAPYRQVQQMTVADILSSRLTHVRTLRS